MLKHKGTQEIRTKRLLLRKIRASDYRDMYVYTQKAEVAKYVTWDVHKSPSDTETLCEFWAGEYKTGDRYNWAIVFDGRVIGNIDIVKIMGTHAYIGWQIDSAYWNMGIMTEAAIAVRDYMFSQIGIDSLYAAHIRENIGSGRVMRKIGMKQTTARIYYEKLGDAKAHETEIDGMPVDFYRITKYEWLKLHTHRISAGEFEKCSDIWDMKKCPYTAQFKKELEENTCLTYVLDINGGFIAEGSLVLSQNEEGYTVQNQRIYLSRLIVKKENRSIGLGQMMTEYLIESAKNLGYSEITVGVDVENKPALHIYQKFGFSVFETSRDEHGKYYKMLLDIKGEKDDNE